MKVIKQAATGLAVIVAIAACGSSIPGSINAPHSLSAPVASAISFMAYPAPEGFPNAHRAGETSIGTVKGTNDALIQMEFVTARIKWDDAVDPATASWSNVTYTTHHATYDPILWTDRVTGRTFVSLLLPGTAITSFTDDGGTSWTPTVAPTTLIGFDHGTIASGPYTVPRPNQAYSNATYYCIGFLISTCARSDDGSLTWGAPVVTDPLGDCGLNHGRPVVGPDGSVYVPRNVCGSTQGMLVSRDEGATWSKFPVSGTVSLGVIGGPAVAFDAAGRIYFATASAGRPVIATSVDGGKNWSPLVDVGEAFKTSNTAFAMVVAGDAGRAAFAFYGTPTEGDGRSADFTGVWHLYVSSTFDGGATWQTVDATPIDPVQRGCVGQGSGYPRGPDSDLPLPLTRDGRPDESLDGPCFNQRDYQDMTVDPEGRVLISYADGCTSAACLAPNGTPADSNDSLATISRQTSGRRLYAAFDR